jgi:hypothetical protein
MSPRPSLHSLSAPPYAASQRRRPWRTLPSFPLAEQGANKDNHGIVKRRHLDAHTNATAVRQVGSSLMVL